MNDLTADPPSIQGYGGEVSALGGRISSDIKGSKDGLDATTEGLKTPTTFAGLVEVWSQVCEEVSSEVTRAGEGTTQAGNDHSSNEDAQTEGMNARAPK